ncbi:MAG: hypothetical protein R2877_05860 [Bdellovibrionota bacterium]
MIDETLADQLAKQAPTIPFICLSTSGTSMEKTNTHIAKWITQWKKQNILIKG